MRFDLRSARTLLVALLAMAGTACDALSPDFLDREPTDLLLEEQMWNDPQLVMGLLANYYDRLPETHSISHNYHGFAHFDDAMWSGGGNDPNNLTSYPYGWWGIWDYGLIRDLNLFLEKVGDSELDAEQIARFQAEGRFLRAYVYFEMAKRMGGVPLITQTYEYDFSGDPSYLQLPRATEAETYDFIAAELDAVMNELPAEANVTRATRWSALALKTRAMLYAGSLAKNNNAMPQPIRTSGGEVGIPENRAQGYFEASLAAAQEIIESGPFSLYRGNTDPGENFYEAITRMQNNPEVIWARAFTLEGKYHNFVFENIPRSLREDNENSASISPSLNLVEAFEYLDGSDGKLRTRDESGDFIYYDHPADIFEGKDGRLWGTVVYPGATFRGAPVSVQAGVLRWNEAAGVYDEITSTELGSRYEDGGVLVGADGPLTTEPNVTTTGFTIRKYLDPRSGSGQRGQGSDIWWIRFRYGEVLLNAAEAALELGRTAEALQYVNEVRERAGFGPNSLTTLTMERLRNERRVELAFENHRFYDMKRWRLAHEAWDGDRSSPDAMIRALWPYRVVRPGDPRDGKYVFIERDAPRLAQPRFFRFGNYYSEISQGIRNANPKIVPNPFH